MKLSAWSAVLVGILYNYTRLFSDGLYAFWSTAAYFPIILALIELYFRRQRRFAMFLFPWMLAFPFVAVHVETALRLELMAGVYFLFHLYATTTIDKEDKWKHLAAFAAAGLGGILLASPQLAAGTEYAGNSYNSVWRILPEYGWLFRTIHKHLAADDFAAVFLGIIGVAASILLVRPRENEDVLSKGSLLRAALAAAAFALGAAALAAVGMDDSLEKIATFDRPIYSQASWATGIFLLFLSLWAWRKTAATGARAAGWLYAFALLTMLKVPPVSTLLAHLPYFKLFNNTLYMMEFDLFRAILAAFGLEACLTLAGESWHARKTAVLAAFRVSAVFVLGFAAAQGLQPILPAHLTTSQMPNARVERPPGGGFTTPERITTFKSSYFFTGWIPSFPPAAAVVVGYRYVQKLGNATETRLTASGGRQYFKAEMPLPDRADAKIFAQALYPNGQKRLLEGPELRILKRPAFWILIAAALAAPLFLFAPAKLVWAVYAWLVLLCAASRTVPTIPAEQFPLQIPAVDKIKEDPSRFRVFSFDFQVLSADYPNIYGLEDLRTGGDNLDILPMLYFQRLALSLIQERENSAKVEAGIKLLGIANVKYVFDRAGAKFAHPALSPFHSGKVLTVYENKRTLPRVQFYERAQHVPVGKFTDWRNQNAVYGPMLQVLSSPGFDPQTTLILTESPQGALPPALGKATASFPKLEITRYEPNRAEVSVDSPRAGYVLLADNIFPGWRARLNGNSVPILRGWLTFRVVAVPAGRSRIEFVYTPSRLYLTVFISVLLAIVWVFLYIGYRASRPPLETSAAEEKPEGKKKKKKGKAEPIETDEDAAVLAYALEKWALVLTVPTIVYWTYWAGFVFKGAAWINAAAWLLALSSAGYAYLLIRRGPSQASCAEKTAP
jgi:hypothetical protein